MKYLKQFLIIIAISFAGEVLHYFIPLPVPASIYGMVLLFAGICTGLIPLSAVKETGDFLVAMMQIMFIPATVGLIDSWDILKDRWPVYLIITFVTTMAVLLAVGKVVQLGLARSKRKEGRENA